ncbi:MAG: SusC/RagA family TonB-linked outer membrane protein [Paludibacter sp.]|nr:SusC/RagA family TonB-linked outer membrane protein [Paludibacter sp.]
MKKLYKLFLILLMSTNIVMAQDNKVVSQAVIEQGKYADGNTKIKLPFREVDQLYLSGAATVISEEDLQGKSDVNFISTLKGKAAGLYISEIPGAHREGSYNISIRGLNTQNFEDATPLIIVDGMERPLSYLQVEDIESITVLKDAVTKSFYKGKAANGVIMVKTKRGKQMQNKRQINIESGVSMPSMLPEMLGSAEYASYYNQARRNSGQTDLYSAADILAYENNSNNIMYPSNNYYDLLLKDTKNFTKASALFSGGSDGLQYFLSANYLHNGGLEAVGNPNTMDQFSVRSNLDFKISESVKAFLDVYGFLDNNITNYLQPSDLFTRLFSQRPNEYAVLLENHVDPDSVMYGSGRYGNSSTYQNTYAEMLLGGLRKNTQRVGQTNLGFKFDLSSLLKGLQAKTVLSFDTYNYVSVGKNDNFYSYMPVWSNDSLTGKTLVTVGNKNSNMSTLGSDGYRRYSLLGQLDYENRFDDHGIRAGLVVLGDQTENMFVNYVNKTQSNTLLLNYSYQDKWVADVNLGLIGSSKLSKNNRYGFFPAAGLSWIISNEDFMMKMEKLNYLKLKASYGVSGNDDALNYFAYSSRWNYINSSDYYTYFGTDAKTVANTTTINSFANPSIDWERSTELNVGLEAVFFKNFTFNLDYYNMLRTNVPVYANSLNSGISGMLNQQINFVSINNNGVDASLAYLKSIGEWKINININANYALSKYIQSDSWANTPGSRNYDGQPVDTYIGLISTGIIKNTEELNGNSFQSFGEVEVGDLGYKELTGDGKVDQNDVKEIGNSFPRIQYGVNLRVDYKDFGLALSGYGATLYDIYLNNKYYRPMPEIAYSVNVSNSFNPETGVGTYPRLTTTNSSNNYRLSDFWLTDGSFFKIKDVEISYNLPASVVRKVSLNSLRLFVKGNNLLTLTGVEGVDPECINAGIVSYPFMRSFTAGLNLTF